MVALAKVNSPEKIQFFGRESFFYCENFFSPKALPKTFYIPYRKIYQKPAKHDEFFASDEYFANYYFYKRLIYTEKYS